MDLQHLRTRYISERPAYEQLARDVAQTLERECRKQGINCTVDARAKDVSSLVKKAIRTKYTNPWDEITDKAGVRVTVVYESAIEQVEAIVRSHFDVLRHDDKRQTIDPKQLDYLGVHFGVSVPDENIRSGRDRARICEIQLHTSAQTLWATVSHELIYKGAQQPPIAVVRAIHRLMALLELFDTEVERGRQAIMSQPGFAAASLLATLERHFLSLTGRQYAPELSLQVISALAPLIDDTGEHATRLDGFVEGHREKLEAIFRDYRDDDRNVLVSQPESILIFERLENDRFRLSELWPQHFPGSLLESMAGAWGVAIDV